MVPVAVRCRKTIRRWLPSSEGPVHRNAATVIFSSETLFYSFGSAAAKKTILVRAVRAYEENDHKSGNNHEEPEQDEGRNVENKPQLRHKNYGRDSDEGRQDIKK